LDDRIQSIPLAWINLENDRLDHLNEKIQLLDPAFNLQRGFSITRQQGKVIKSIKDINKNAPIQTDLVDGSITSHIRKNKEK